jgi:Flp pilus assembly pilin Flp
MFEKVKGLAVKFHREQKGQGVMEYFIVIVTVALIASFYLTSLSSDGIGPKFNELTNKVKSIKLPDMGVSG